MDDEVLYEIALCSVPGLGPIGQKELIRKLGSAKKVFDAGIAKLKTVNGIGPVIANNIKSDNFIEHARNELMFCAKHKIEIYSYFHSINYPQNLKRCIDAPLILYKRGKINSDKRLHIGIVGTRDASDYGIRICAELVEALKDYNPIIVSGLAMGVDIEAHRKALKFGLDTIAVVAHGLDRVYPREHYNVAIDILNQGYIMTEFTTGVKPDRENFPARNRIIAGMCDAIVVVEAKLKGGALITAEIANSYGRDVFTFPGKVYDKRSQGCNALIKNNLASMLTSPQDIIDILQLSHIDFLPIQKKLFIDIADDEKILIDLLENSSTGLEIDVLMTQSGFSFSKLSSQILSLEMKGIIKVQPGKKVILL